MQIDDSNPFMCQAGHTDRRLQCGLLKASVAVSAQMRLIDHNKIQLKLIDYFIRNSPTDELELQEILRLVLHAVS